MGTNTEPQAKKPRLTEVKLQIRLLREFIEDDSNDPLERRIAQVKEDTLRWVVEATDWSAPVDDMGMASIIEKEFFERYGSNA